MRSDSPLAATEEPEPQPAAIVPLSPSQRARLKALIATFEDDWFDRRKPSIEQLLPLDDETLRWSALTELVHIELELRFKAGESVSLPEYLARFPELADDPAVEQSLLEAEQQLRARTQPKPAQLDTVLRQLEDTGLIAASTMANFVQPQPPPTSAEELVRELVRQQFLTGYQASQVAAGNGKSLILGGYTILDKIGAGGMGRVFKAYHRRMDRIVAIKMLPEATVGDAGAIARFERETRVAARLLHPNIVTAFDADQAHGVHFLVMEYVDGQNLHALVKRDGPCSVANSVRYILQAARGLEFAHAEGVVHRDIKPANLLLDKKGVVKVLDLGLARLASVANVAAHAELTGTGAVLGTVDFMAPEQARCTKLADGRSDIYSLGITLWYLLTGRPTYGGETLTARLLAHQTAPVPSLQQARSDVPAAVDAVYQKMVAKAPAERFQTMTEMIAALEASLPAIAASATNQFPSTAASRDASVFAAEIGSAVPPAASITASPGPLGNPARADRPGRSERFGPRSIKSWISNPGRIVLAVGLLVILYLLLGPGGPTADRHEKPLQDLVRPVGLSAIRGPTSVRPHALRFDGQKAAVIVDGLRFDHTEPCTLEARYRRSSAGATASLITARNGAHWLGLYSEKGTDGGGISGVIYKDVLYEAPHPGVDATSDAWVVAAIVWDGSASKTFINGARAEHFFSEDITVRWDRTALSDLSRGPAYVIGAAPSGPTQPLIGFFAGEIDEIRVSSIARYTDNYEVPDRFAADEHTTVLYHCDEGEGDVVHDSSGNNHHGRILGAEWVSLEPPPPAVAPFDARQAQAHQAAWSAYLNVPVEYTNHIGMKFRLIPPGEFIMGSTVEETEDSLRELDGQTFWQDCVRDERPQHRVVITQPIYLGVNDVTQGQYEQVMGMGTNKSYFSSNGIGTRIVAGTDTSRYPVETVSWHDAANFCVKLSLQENHSPCYSGSGPTVNLLKGDGYRLPTEAEWEFACRAGTTTRFWIADDEFPQAAWFRNNSAGRTRPVAALRANPFGLYDMHGHIWEWVQDKWERAYYQKFAARPAVDPTGPAPGTPLRIMRGGSFQTAPSNCRSGHRRAFAATYRKHDIGFRVALPVSTVQAELRSPSTPAPVDGRAVP